jgi:hypothetical protein
MRIEVDIASYITDLNKLNKNPKKKQSSTIITNLKRQIEKDSRFIHLLCSNSRKKPFKTESPIKRNTLSIPNLDYSSESSSMTPFQNTILRTMQTPISSSITKNPSSFSTHSSGSEKQKPRKTNPGHLFKLTKKRIFKSIDHYEPLRINLTQKLKKRLLHGENPEFRMFDPQEIMNITNGKFELSKRKPRVHSS